MLSNKYSLDKANNELLFFSVEKQKVKLQFLFILNNLQGGLYGILDKPAHLEYGFTLNKIG